MNSRPSGVRGGPHPMPTFARPERTAEATVMGVFLVLCSPLCLWVKCLPGPADSQAVACACRCLLPVDEADIIPARSAKLPDAQKDFPGATINPCSRSTSRTRLTGLPFEVRTDSRLACRCLVSWVEQMAAVARWQLPRPSVSRPPSGADMGGSEPEARKFAAQHAVHKVKCIVMAANGRSAPLNLLPGLEQAGPDFFIRVQPRRRPGYGDDGIGPGKVAVHCAGAPRGRNGGKVLLLTGAQLDSH